MEYEGYTVMVRGYKFFILRKNGKFQSVISLSGEKLTNEELLSFSKTSNKNDSKIVLSLTDI